MDTIEKQQLIIEALRQLDPDDDGHWTKDGAPMMEVVQSLLPEIELRRSDLNDAAPTLTRGTYNEWIDPSAPLPPTEELDDDLAEMAKLKEAIAAQQQLVTAEQMKLENMVAAMDKLIIARGDMPRMNSGEMVKHHLERQREHRAARMAANSGKVELAPVDQSYRARKRQSPTAPVDFSGGVVK